MKYATKKDLAALDAMLTYLKRTSVENGVAGEAPTEFKGKQSRQLFYYSSTKGSSFEAWDVNGHNGNAENEFSLKDVKLPEGVVLRMKISLYADCKERAKSQILSRLIRDELNAFGILPVKREP